MENEKVQLDDVQGLIIKGYGALPHAVYLMLHFNEPAKAKEWIGNLEVTDAATSSKTIDTAVNIAFTHEGLAQLGITPEISKTFPREFEEGMTKEYRQRILHDFGDSAPENWEWGSAKDDMPIHAVLMLFASDQATFDQLLAEQKTGLDNHQISITKELDTNMLPGNKEHFGFKDGIGQPVIKNAARNEAAEHEANLIKPGEFVFGYINEYDKYIDSPLVPPEKDPDNILQPDKVNNKQKDLGRNGSMMVFRQLGQDVKKFWEFLDQASKEQQATNTSGSKEALGAKMVGRWMDGSPLTKCPYNPDPEYNTFDKFGYADKDFDGFKCPVGSHIRRANPRDNLVRNSSGDPEKDKKDSEKFMKRFRILRRGRPYGKPVSESFNPDDVLQSDDTDSHRGIHFICFNTSIARQFELIQQTWINNPKFEGLYDDPDPIAGDPGILPEDKHGTTFTEPARPLRKKVHGIPRFVTTRGGAYFFMPGITGLKFLSKM